LSPYQIFRGVWGRILQMRCSFKRNSKLIFVLLGFHHLEAWFQRKLSRCRLHPISQDPYSLIITLKLSPSHYFHLKSSNDPLLLLSFELLNLPLQRPYQYYPMISEYSSLMLLILIIKSIDTLVKYVPCSKIGLISWISHFYLYVPPLLDRFCKVPLPYLEP
jgi:hypothetical protein